MKSLPSILLTGLAIFALYSCGNEQKSPKENPLKNLEKEVMAIHDEAMPMNSSLIRTAEDLKSMMAADSINTVDRAAEINQTIEALESAEEAMMSWMNTYRVPAKADENEKKAYLEAEKEKISKVKIQMETALKKGEELKASLNSQ
ncbi:MAG: hypothetical protein R2769_17220 [Saprospiraceae bacterium]